MLGMEFILRIVGNVLAIYPDDNGVGHWADIYVDDILVGRDTPDSIDNICDTTIKVFVPDCLDIGLGSVILKINVKFNSNSNFYSLCGVNYGS